MTAGVLLQRIDTADDFSVLDGVRFEDPRFTVGAKEVPLRVRWNQ